MKSLNDPSIDELRDPNDAHLLGRAPAQAWLKPVRVTLHRAADVQIHIATLQDHVLGSAITVPDAVLEFVIWDPGFGPPSARRIKPSREILEQFLRLATATDSEILGFASKFGPLLIYCVLDEAPLKNQTVVIESCEVWRYFATCMQALLRIAASFYAGHSGNPKDWDAIGTCPRKVLEAPETVDLLSPTPVHGEGAWKPMTDFIRKGDRDRDRRMWARLVNVLLEIGRVRPWVVWQGSGSTARPQIVFSGPNVLSYLALQLSLTASKHDAFSVCSYCNKEYTPSRAPKTGQRNFCQDCRASGVPVRIGQRNRARRLPKKE